MLRSLQAAIVDLDGTMVDTLGDFEVALNRTLADLDLPPVTRALVERTVGKGSEHLIRSVLTHQQLPTLRHLSMAPRQQLRQRLAQAVRLHAT